MKVKFEKYQEPVAVGSSVFADFRNDIDLYNLRTLRQISCVGMVAGIALFLLCFPPFRVFGLVYSYLALAVVFTALYLWCLFGLERRRRMVLPTFYLIGFLLLYMASIMGTYLGQNANATTVLLLILVLPLFVIDKPWRLHVFFGIMTAIFCVMDYSVKLNRELMKLDIANCVAFYLLSVAISRQAIKTRLADIIIKHELKQQRDMDMLTKLNNRGSFERIVERYLHESNQNAVLMLMDIDDFKRVNDTLGHAKGDQLLQQVGEYLKAAFRSGDTVSRLGGDEFIAFLPAVTDMGVIKEKVDSLLQKISEISLAQERSCPVGASVGLAQYPEDGCSFEDLYKQADAALYHAKRSGKGQFAVYDEIAAPHADADP